MNIKPLRDIIVAKPIGETDRVGLLHMPENFKQGLRVHIQALVLAAGPEAIDDAPAGSIVHVSESWGERLDYGDKSVRIGRLRDINGVVHE